jgi:hypothetical protein
MNLHSEPGVCQRAACRSYRERHTGTLKQPYSSVPLRQIGGGTLAHSLESVTYGLCRGSVCRGVARSNLSVPVGSEKSGGWHARIPGMLSLKLEGV